MVAQDADLLIEEHQDGQLRIGRGEGAIACLRDARRSNPSAGAAQVHGDRVRPAAPVSGLEGQALAARDAGPGGGVQPLQAEPAGPVADRLVQAQHRPVPGQVRQAGGIAAVEARHRPVARDPGVDRVSVALVPGDEMEFGRRPPAPLGPVVEAGGRSQHQIRADQQAGAMVAPAGVDPADGAPGVLHGLDDHPAVRVEDNLGLGRRRGGGDRRGWRGGRLGRFFGRGAGAKRDGDHEKQRRQPIPAAKIEEACVWHGVGRGHGRDVMRLDAADGDALLSDASRSGQARDAAALPASCTGV